MTTNPHGGDRVKLDVQHDQERRRFFAVVEGLVAHLDYEHEDENTLDYRHTWVPESLRNRGIGARLVRDALDWARANGYRVIPSCSFVDAIVRRDFEYGDLVADRT